MDPAPRVRFAPCSRPLADRPRPCPPAAACFDALLARAAARRGRSSSCSLLTPDRGRATSRSARAHRRQTAALGRPPRLAGDRAGRAVRGLHRDAGRRQGMGRPHRRPVLLAAARVGYNLGARTEGRHLWAGVVRSATVAQLRRHAVDTYPDGFPSFLNSVALAIAGPVLFAQVHAQPRAAQPRAAREGARARREPRRARPRAAALEERTRIAGELHDVVAHALSAMTVQAAAARRMAERDPARAEASFATVEATGREALTELRRLLGVLRREDEELGLAPQPSLAHVGSLIRRARRGRAAGRAADRGRARAAAGRRRPDRLPARAGGAAPRARGRARCARACA